MPACSTIFSTVTWCAQQGHVRRYRHRPGRAYSGPLTRGQQKILRLGVVRRRRGTAAAPCGCGKANDPSNAAVRTTRRYRIVEMAVEVGMDEATAETWRAEPRSKVTFDMEDVGRGVVKLTVTHDGFSPGQRARPSRRAGPPCCRV